MMPHIKSIFRSNAVQRLRRLVYWLLPPAMLFIIFRKIDIGKLGEIFSDVRPWLLFVGLGYYPLVVVCAGIRWKVAMQCYFHEKVPTGFVIKHYWIGMVLGFFSPGQIGIDLYRVVIGRRFVHFLHTLFIVTAEKITGLLAAMFLLLIIYPAVEPLIVAESIVLERILRVTYWTGGLGLALTMVFSHLFNRALGARVAERLTASAHKVLDRFTPHAGQSRATVNTEDLSKILKLFSRPFTFFWVFFWSLMIQVIASAGNQIIFQSLGYEISFWINLFTVPLLYVIFLLPISFGSLGIREGAYILLYGFFGVPAEVAVLVSFINLIGIMFNNAVGALLIWTNRPLEELPRSIANQES